MADEQVRIDVIADDQASKKLDAVADKVDKLEDATPKIPVAADTNDAERDIAGLLAKVDRLAADPATLLLTSNAAAIAGDIAGLIGDIDRLDAADPAVTVKVDQINALQGDLDMVEQKLRDINATDVTIDTRKAQQGLGDVAKSADSSKSVLANMVGNATQDLGALGGVAGSAGVAIGQMGEYMADAKAQGDKLGDIVRNFGKIAGPVAGIALFTEVLGKLVAAGKEVQDLSKERSEGFFDSIRDGADAFAALRREVEETGKLDFGRPGAGFLGLAPGIESVLPLLDKAKIRFGDWQRMIEEWPTKSQGYIDSLKQAGLSAGEAEDVLIALMQATGAKQAADERAAAATRFLTDETMSERDAMLAAKEAEGKRVDSLDDAAAAAADTARETAQLEGATMRAEQAARDMAAAWDALTGKLDAEQAIANIGTDFDDMRDKGAAAWDATAKGADDAAQKQADYAQSVRDAKGDVIDLGKQIGLSVPEVKRMLLQIDDGEIDDVERKLAILTRNRTMNLSIIASGGPGYGSGSGTGNSTRPSMAPVEVVNVTQHLPRGWRGDALGAARQAARRSGGLYRRSRR